MPKKPKVSLFAHHRVTMVFLAIFLGLLAGIIGHGIYQQSKVTHEQAALDPFYQTPTGFESAEPGQILKQEPMDINLPDGARAVRVLYRSERGDGTPTVSSGMVFIPSGTTNQPRPVVAWAHGTIGLGDSCAPSRSDDPTDDMTWLGGMLDRGWIVTATDYAGLGTAGTSGYLVGGDESRDVLNSVRAARTMDPMAGSQFALFGHSQGGHSALWTTNTALGYAPELSLVGTAAAAPAAELTALFQEQYQKGPSWVIGPDVATTWPTVYPNLDLASAITESGLHNASTIAHECATESGVGAIVRTKLHEDFFKTDPMSIPSWRAAADDQTPKPPAENQPLLVAQSLFDQIVLPDTTALLVQQYCQAGSNLQTLWIDDVTHQKTAITVGPSVTEWLADRFAGRSTNSTCGQSLPITPAAVPAS